MGAAAKFRRRCGAQLRQQARFCGACGGAVAAAPADPAPPADTPIRHSIAGMPMWQAAAIGAAVSLAVLAWQQGWLGKAGDTMAAATGIGDTFLSDETMQFAFARAMIRDRPTAQASTVLGALAPGDSATGRWVQGTDPSTRWLKTADGYVWDGNLAAEDSITSAGMLGLVVGMPLARMRERLDPVGMYGGQIPDWDANACEIYRSRDGRASVMVEEARPPASWPKAGPCAPVMASASAPARPSCALSMAAGWIARATPTTAPTISCGSSPIEASSFTWSMAS